MEFLKIENLNFSYPKSGKKVLNNISISINRGDFVCLCGKSGCGKTTLLSLLKPALSPTGILDGSIIMNGTALREQSEEEQAFSVGYVMQNPDNQIVTDKVWHELAFGLESLGMKTEEIRIRVGEIASFFNLQNQFHQKTSDLSGGQKQILNLASVMVMQPDLLILDEPTSQLDPIAADEFLKTLEKINRELGTTIIISEHRLEEVFPLANKIVVLHDGKVIADGDASEVEKCLREAGNDMYAALPTPMRIHASVKNSLPCPVTVREGRNWLEEYSHTHTLDASRIKCDTPVLSEEYALELKDLWFRYDKNLPDIIKGLNLKIHKGEIFALLGGNGNGKTTLMSLINGINIPYRGSIKINGANKSDIRNLYDIAVTLPQSPQSIFSQKTVKEELEDTTPKAGISADEQTALVNRISSICDLDSLHDRHPYDLSGGEQQRLALAKVLSKDADILLLDEPTKGFDAPFKQIFADILADLKSRGITVIMVSHDIEFCAQYADRCGLLFDGNIISSAPSREFFAGNSFYTTSANRMARGILPEAVLAEDIIHACTPYPVYIYENKSTPTTKINNQPKPKENEICSTTKKSIRLPDIRRIFGAVLMLAFIAVCFSLIFFGDKQNYNAMQYVAFGVFAAALLCLVPKSKKSTISLPKRKLLTRSTIVALIVMIVAIPLTIYAGMKFFDNRKYYFISLLIILETFIPFLLSFEASKPKAGEIVIIAVLCAIAVAGRTAFFMLPQFKPVAALIIIFGASFGCETGFLTGTVTAFVSNFYYGQGMWTPWQMFAFGAIGFLAGIILRSDTLKNSRIWLSVVGFILTVCVYGGIVNWQCVIFLSSTPDFELIKSTYLLSLPFDLTHGASTVFFMCVIAKPMFEKLDRIKIKYGIGIKDITRN